MATPPVGTRYKHWGGCVGKRTEWWQDGGKVWWGQARAGRSELRHEGTLSKGQGLTVRAPLSQTYPGAQS